MTATATVPPLETIAPELVSRVRTSDLSRPLVVGLGVAAVGIGASLLLVSLYGWAQFLFSYLVAYMFVLSLALGSLFFVLLQHATRAGWSVVVRRVAENMMGVLPWMPLFFLPIALGSHTLYHHWMEPLPGDRILHGKEGYLNAPFFFVRAGIYFVVWAALAIFFRRSSVKQDQTGDPAITLRMARVAAPGILLFALTSTFAAVDWLMTLDPHWFSTMWGVYYFAGTFMVQLAALALVCLWLERRGDLRGVVTTEHFHDIGKLLFAFVVFWTYIAFSQYMLIWYANLPEETVWYQDRTRGSWETVAEVLIVGHFAIPFAFLMSRHMKRNRVTLAMAAVFMMGMQWVDLHWVAMPALHRDGMQANLMDATTMIGLLGAFFALTVANIKQVPRIPERDPRLRESLMFENH